MPSGGQDDELQRFDELARYTAIYLGHADLKGEAARDFLAVLLRDYFMEQTTSRQEVGLVGHDKEATIEFPFKAAKIYLGVLANLAPAPESEIRTAQPTQPYIRILKSKATVTMKEAAGIYDVDESTIRKRYVEPNGLLKLAEGTKRITTKSIADHLDLDLKDK